MKKILLLIVAISFTSCGGYFEYLQSPEGQAAAERQFQLDSIRAANTQYPFRGNFNYYRANNLVPVYYNYYRPYRGAVIIRRSYGNRTRINRPSRTRTRVTRTNAPRVRRNNGGRAPRGGRRQQ